MDRLVKCLKIYFFPGKLSSLACRNCALYKRKFNIVTKTEQQMKTLIHDCIEWKPEWISQVWNRKIWRYCCSSRIEIISFFCTKKYSTFHHHNWFATNFGILIHERVNDYSDSTFLWRGPVDIAPRVWASCFTPQWSLFGFPWRQNF